MIGGNKIESITEQCVDDLELLDYMIKIAIKNDCLNTVSQRFEILIDKGPYGLGTITRGPLVREPSSSPCAMTMPTPCPLWIT